MVKIIKLYNIELRLDKSNNKEWYNIVKYEPNQYYGKENNYQFDGVESYTDPNQPNYSINKSCFQNPESCYVIAYFNINPKEPDCQLEFCGDRPLNLSNDEFDHFMEVVRYGYKIITKQLNNREDGLN